MASTQCSECDEEIEIGGRVRLGQKIICGHCGAQLEVVATDPLEVDVAQEEDDGWEDDELDDEENDSDDFDDVDDLELEDDYEDDDFDDLDDFDDDDDSFDDDDDDGWQ